MFKEIRPTELESMNAFRAVGKECSFVLYND